MTRKHIAIVTGGLQGMGLAIAAKLASRGIHVAVGARRGADENLAAVAREAIGGDCLVAPLDVRSVESVESAKPPDSALGDRRAGGILLFRGRRRTHHGRYPD
jgi:NAD(P)-dependent dehydrogenase (short-subunit alcohol dehydrogenase family)